MEDPTLEQVDGPERGYDPVGSSHWHRLLAVSVDPWRERGAHTGAGLLAGIVTPGDTHTVAVLKDCNPWKGPTLEQFVKNCGPWEGPTLKKIVEGCLP